MDFGSRASSEHLKLKQDNHKLAATISMEATFFFQFIGIKTGAKNRKETSIHLTSSHILCNFLLFGSNSIEEYTDHKMEYSKVNRRYFPLRTILFIYLF